MNFGKIECLQKIWIAKKGGKRNSKFFVRSEFGTVPGGNWRAGNGKKTNSAHKRTNFGRRGGGGGKKG